MEALAEIANIKLEFVFYSADVSKQDSLYYGHPTNPLPMLFKKV